MKKWTNQQKLLCLCGVIGSGLALNIIMKSINIGPKNANEILGLAEEIGAEDAIKVLKKAKVKVINLSDYKNVV